MDYILGLDLGIKSAAAALVKIDKREEPYAVEKLAVHLFDGGEHPKNGASLALPRRQKRLQRRILRRRSQRTAAIRTLFINSGIKIDFDDKAYQRTDPWVARQEGLDRKLTHAEFCKALLHIAKRRGFQSNRKKQGPDNDAEGKKLLTGVTELSTAFNSNQIFCKSIGSYLATQAKKRNSPGEYNRTVLRSLLKEGVHYPSVKA